jgi:exodeoxyribonuclease V alpha subunit
LPLVLEACDGRAMLEGVVQAIRFVNPENFWTVASVRTPEGEATVVGPLPGLSEGMTVRAEGRWEDNPRFGRRFKSERYTEVVPATKEGLARYLASGFVPGIGDKLARRLVDAFGDKTIDVILAEPARLGDVPGLGQKRAKALQEAFRERRGAQDALVFLMGLEIPRGLALRILKKYGDDTVAQVRQNPFKLAQEVHGIGFIKADQVARGLDIAADHPERIAAGLVHAMREARDEGHVRVLRDALFARACALLSLDRPAVEPVLARLVELGRLVQRPHEDPARSDEVVYLTPLWEAEVGVVTHLRRLAAVARPAFDPSPIGPAAARLDIALAPGQERAVALALDSAVAIVTGGPGTGKTTIIRTLLECAPDAPNRVALAAPTGRAAKRMAEATGRPALTIHRLLEFNPQEGQFQRDEHDPLAADLVIIDEASMVDLPLFFALVRAIPTGARLVLVGDKDQLPPVGPGAPLTDLIASGAIAVARLSDIYRQGKGSAIVEAAHALNEGRMVAPTPQTEALRDFYFVLREDPEQIRQTIEQLVVERIPERFGLDPVRDVQVLAPMRAGPIGVEVLNQRLQALLNPLPARDGEDFKLEAAPAPAPFRAGDKVMQIRNDYERGVFNGDMGIVRRLHGGELHVEVDERLVVYERDAWDDLVLAYAVTVHKSQGSEYPAVVIPVSTHHFKMLRRNLLYTAVTRGKRLVVLVGTERAMRIAVGNAAIEVRESGLAAALAHALTSPNRRG